MVKESLESLAQRMPIEGQRAFVRVDFNVPQDSAGNITDDTRIRGALPTIEFLVSRGAKVVLASHLGRPKGKPTPSMSLAPIATRLGELLGSKSNVSFVENCIGQDVENHISKMKNGDAVVLENLRFHPQEEQNEANFAASLASLADFYVNDAFGTAHRAHASTEGVAHILNNNCVGFLMEKELQYLENAVEQPRRPFAAIVGGSKVSSKITVIESLLKKVNVLIIGGGMVFTFLRARGINTGSSMVEEDKIELAKELEKMAAKEGVELILPVDFIVADKFAADANTQIVDVNSIPDGWMGLDQGPSTTSLLNEKLQGCETIIWNGPVGVFEMDAFAQGTFAVAQTLADVTKQKNATTIVGGGDSVAAVQKAGLGGELSHISTGGGASLELLEGKVLPGVAVIQERIN